MEKLLEFALQHPDLLGKVVDLINNLVTAAKDHPVLMDALASRIKGA